MSMDLTGLLWLNELIGHSPRFFHLGLTLSDRIPWIIMSMMLCWMWFVGSPGLLPRKPGGILNIHARHLALMSILSLPVLFILSQGLQALIQKPRPMHIPELLAIPIPPQIWTTIVDSFPPVGSFPSDHAVVMGLILGCLFRLHRGFGLVAALVVLFFSLLRVALGFHWPSDLAAGLLLGLLAACVIVFSMPYHLHISQSINRYTARNLAVFHVILFSFFYDFSQKFSSIFRVLNGLKQMVGA